MDTGLEIRYYREDRATMAASKSKAEKNALIVCTVFTFVGTSLCICGLFVPYWYERVYNNGLIRTEANLGMWLDRICVGVPYQDDDCKTYWVTEDGYDRPEPHGHMPYGELIRWFETVATGLAILSIPFLALLWTSRNSSPCRKYTANACYFATVMIAGFAAVVGTLILSSKGNDDNANWAAFLSGVGGALLFISGCLNCIICRWDPSYGTLENPVSPKYLVSS